MHLKKGAFHKWAGLPPLPVRSHTLLRLQRNARQRNSPVPAPHPHPPFTHQCLKVKGSTCTTKCWLCGHVQQATNPRSPCSCLCEDRCLAAMHRNRF